MLRTLPLAAALAVLASPAAADPLSDVVSRHLAWRGGGAFEALTSVHQQGRVEAAGLSGTVDAWTDRKGEARQDVDLGAVRELTAVTAADAWTRNMSGQIEDLDAHMADDARDGAALMFAGALHGEGGAKLNLLPAETMDGRSWSVVRVNFGDPDTYDLFLDPKTGALHALRAVENKRKRIVRYGDWRMVDGVRMAFSESSENENAAANAKVVYGKIELNRAPAAELFQRPADAATYAFANGASGTGWVDFDFFNGNRIYIPAAVNGTPVQVLLDSGAEATVLDKRFAEKLGLKTVGELPAEGTGGSSTAALATGVDVVIGDMTLKNLTVAIIDLSEVEKRIGRPMPVILGKEAFNQLAVDIDFASHRIAFHDPAKLVPPPGAVAVPVKEVGGLRAVEVSVEGRPPVLLDFDIGNGSPLLLYSSFWEPQKLMDGRPASKALAGAIGGAREQGMVTVKSLSFGGVEFRDIPTVLSTPGAAAVDSDRTFGNLGLPVISRFRLITDYPKDTLYLVPQADAAALPFPKDRSGLQIVAQGDRLKVLYVAPGSPGQAAGWKAGEEITAVDGHTIGADYNGSELSKWRNGEAGRTVDLTMVDGTKRKLTLKTYF
ncbi:aspartyl protease family protein [Caulobacter sp. 17J80-11]|uniref:aspartyl protease family protein n=1 Tax=Caulobacter sp. 17J80-11 TaxID=2763502 RepID=UPI0016535C05|nr:aspartyl protease family protein [Caulobacter sp. 17J80-11]MBC6982311.1 aspartyl protease family protein [Caulobacter sp. 17J80-11]